VSALRVVCCSLVLVFVSISSTAAEEIYRWRDAQGTIHFADAPPTYPAEVSRLDGKSAQPTVRTPQASRTALRSSSAPVSRSISSLIGGAPRSPSRRITTGALPGASPGRNSRTSGSDPLSQNTVVGRLGSAGTADAAARRNEAGNDLAVPSLDHALADPVSAGDGSERPPAPYRRLPLRRSRLLVEAENP
jgi:hypothetical protein